MAEVYVARAMTAKGAGKRVAIKRILPQLARDPRFVAMFCDEARICAALCHPNVVQVVDFGEHEGELFMAMEYVDGVSGAKLLRAVAARAERFPLAAAFFIAEQVLAGLGFVHAASDEQGRSLGLVHRDVSPGNILIGKAGEVKLTDFGIVRSEFVARRTYPGELKGKLGYMSPEQVIGEDVSPQSDLFTVGIVLAEMLLTRPLFGGRSEVEILTRIHDADLRVLVDHGGHLPPPVHELLQTAMARDPRRRFPSAEAFRAALLNVAGDCGVSVVEESFVPWLWGIGLFPSQSGTREAVHLPRRSPPSLRPRRVESVGSAALTVRPAPGTGGDVVNARYHVVLRQGGQLGALRLPELLEMVMTGRVTFDALVAEDGVNYRPLAELRALSAYATHSGYRFGESVEPRAKWSSRIDRVRLPAIVYGLCMAQRTGLLVLRQGRREKRVFFRDGEPRFATSTDREELLGARLVAMNLAMPEQVEQALVAASLRGDRRLGECLVSAGVLKPSDLVRALVEQLELSFSEVAQWSNGQLWFLAGQTSADEVPRAVRSALELFTCAIRDGYAVAELASILGPFRAEPLFLVEGAAARYAALGLTEGEQAALALIKHGASLEQVVALAHREAAVTNADALNAIFIGLSSGCLVCTGFAVPDLV
jgi:serine/threonine-protein kinase